MKESCRECVASNSGRDPYAGDGNIAGASSGSGSVGQLLSSEIMPIRVPTLSRQGEGNTEWAAIGKAQRGRGGVEDPVHAWTFQTREPRDPIGFPLRVACRPQTGTGSKRHRRKRRHERR